MEKLYPEDLCQILFSAARHDVELYDPTGTYRGPVKTVYHKQYHIELFTSWIARFNYDLAEWDLIHNTPSKKPFAVIEFDQNDFVLRRFGNLLFRTNQPREGELRIITPKENRFFKPVGEYKQGVPLKSRLNPTFITKSL